MIIVDQTNTEQAKQFIIQNLSRSGFIYGNFNSTDAENYIKIVDGQIVAMTNIMNSCYCTYLFPAGTSNQVVRSVIEFMKNKEHIGGTVIGDYYDIFNDYYQLPANAVNEVAVLTVENNQFKSKQATYLTIADTEKYKRALDKIVEFAPKSIEQVATMFSSSKVVGIKRDDQVVSAATLSSISDINAVVTGVFTVKEHEGHGLAKDCVNKLLEDYATGRTITIFFTNPIAKQMYLNLGFKVNEKLIMYNNK